MNRTLSILGVVNTALLLSACAAQEFAEPVASKEPTVLADSVESDDSFLVAEKMDVPSPVASPASAAESELQGSSRELINDRASRAKRIEVDPYQKSQTSIEEPADAYVDEVMLLTRADFERARKHAINKAELIEMAQDAIAESDAAKRVAPPGNQYARRLKRLTRGLTRYDGMKLNFKVYLAPGVNAFAMPDGSVRVYAGLMDLMTDSELLSVIFHEIGHVKLEHSLYEAHVAYWAYRFVPTESHLTNRAGRVVKILAILAQARYSQNQEIEADE